MAISDRSRHFKSLPSYFFNVTPKPNNKKNSIFGLLRLSLGLLSLSLLMGSCTLHRVVASPYLGYYREGFLEEAEQLESESIDRQLPTGDFRESPNAVLLRLDRATTRLALNEAAGAAEDYDQAIQAIDFYNQTSLSEQLVQTVVQDGLAAYAGDEYEQLLARLYFALTLLHQGDLSNAYAILRQAEDFQQRRAEILSNTPFTCHYRLGENPFAKYLFGLLLEKRGDLSNAKILYEQAGYPMDRTPDAPNSATVLVVCHNGNVPRRVSVTAPASVASAIALEMILQAYCVPPALSSFIGIPVPELIFEADSMPIPCKACLDDQSQRLTPIYDIAAAASRELEDKRPIIVARGVARLALRRALVGVAYEQDQLLGAVTDIAMLISNVNTSADTRSWRTLPWTLDIGRFDVAPGDHTLSLQLGDPGCTRYTQDIALTLPPNSLCIINVFNLHPGVTTVLVPDRFQTCHQGDNPCAANCISSDSRP